MLDPIYVRDNVETVRQRLNARGVDLSNELEQLATLEAHRRRLIPQVEGLKREQNAAGDEVARAKRQGLDARPIFDANKLRAQKIKQMEIELEASSSSAGVCWRRFRIFHTTASRSVTAPRTMSSSAPGARPGRSTSSPKRIGISAPRSGFSISSGRRSCQDRASPC
jgi:seryl-tRNA synthetase